MHKPISRPKQNQQQECGHSSTWPPHRIEKCVKYEDEHPKCKAMTETSERNGLEIMKIAVHVHRNICERITSVYVSSGSSTGIVRMQNNMISENIGRFDTEQLARSSSELSRLAFLCTPQVTLIALFRAESTS
ncbi:hypothetical protein TNCV_3884931 [Trichonephila clavipes]|nr:hypothetical protein TNCV_3884931 [Trichonephila clavipes]